MYEEDGEDWRRQGRSNDRVIEEEKKAKERERERINRKRNVR